MPALNFDGTEKRLTVSVSWFRWFWRPVKLACPVRYDAPPDLLLLMITGICPVKSLLNPPFYLALLSIPAAPGVDPVGSSRPAMARSPSLPMAAAPAVACVPVSCDHPTSLSCSPDP